MRHIRNLITKNNAWLLQRINVVPYFPIWAHLYGSNHHHILDGDVLVWQNKKGKYANHVEMSGTELSSIVSYGVDNKGLLRLSTHLAFPSLRVKPNHTRSNLRHNFKSSLLINGKRADEVVQGFSFDGKLHIKTRVEGTEIDRCMYPVMNKSLFVEKIRINPTEVCLIEFKNDSYTVSPLIAVDGPFYIRSKVLDDTFHGVVDSDILTGNKTYYRVFTADKGQEVCLKGPDVDSRDDFLSHIKSELMLETPNELINKAFDYSKIRVCESIFYTEKGYMHSPGGGGYYAAMWTNDQCEYTNPFLPYIKYDLGHKQSVNSFRMFASYNKIPSSIIAGGDKVWNAAGDRGDAAMFVYGLTRFLLASGNQELALSFIKDIDKAFIYSLSKKNKYGVISSDSDELENRLPSGKANLFTSSLIYDALISMNYIAVALDYTGPIDYKHEALRLEKAIEDYFGATIKGYDTYRYYKGNVKLRSWISIPIVMGILKRKETTIKALFNELWFDQGIQSVEGRDIFWDRSTLYALRAAFMAGQADLALMYLKSYTQKRVLGSHIPYAIEAYPEGNQKHLSGESALYARIITEGLFGIRPIAFDTFLCNPSMPSQWQEMKLKRINLFGITFNIEIRRIDQSYELIIKRDDTVCFSEIGHQFTVKLEEK